MAIKLFKIDIINTGFQIEHEKINILMYNNSRHGVFTHLECTNQSKNVFTYILVHFTLYRASKDILYLKTHSTHFIYGYMASRIW